MNVSIAYFCLVNTFGSLFAFTSYPPLNLIEIPSGSAARQDEIDKTQSLFMTLAVSVLAIQVASYVSAMNVEANYDTKLLLNSAS